MDETQLRNLALEYALRSPDIYNGSDVLAVASAYLAFLTGRTEAPAPLREAA